MLAPVAAGVTTITVTASGADNSIATHQFKVTVLAATAATRAWVGVSAIEHRHDE